MTAGSRGPAVLLDTHALIWWQAGDERMSAPARAAVERAERVCVSAVSAWEMALLVDAERVRLDRPVELGRRGFHRDLADRFLWATAAALRLPLVTKDSLIHAYARGDSSVEVLW